MPPGQMPALLKPAHFVADLHSKSTPPIADEHKGFRAYKKRMDALMNFVQYRRRRG